MQEFMGQVVVVDLRSTYVCCGMLRGFDEEWLELRNVDLHDLRDTQSSREAYVAETRTTGVNRNRKRVLVARAEVVAIGLLEDVVEG